MKRLFPLIVCLTALAAAAPAQAMVHVDGSGEPQFTRGTSNTQWIRWEKPAGVHDYQLRIRWYEDQVKIYEDTTTPSQAASGTLAISFTGIRSPLVEGKTYKICVQGEVRYPGDVVYYPHGLDSCQSGAAQNKGTATRIDRTAPTGTVTTAGGAEYLKGDALPVHIAFEDNLSGPQPANFVCVTPRDSTLTPEANCSGKYVFSPGCSNPAHGGRNVTFDCTIGTSSRPDGQLLACTIVSDGAGPDNPSSPDQSFSQTQTHLSAPSCDTVTLDRTAPSLSVSASKTSVLAGESVAFAAQASDQTSGIDAATARWQWGDGSESSGTSAGHAFAQPGTYTVKHRVSDAAGNEKVAEIVVTVTAPPQPQPDPQPQPGPQPGPQPDPTPNPDSKPEPETKPEPQPETKPEPQPETKPEPGPGALEAEIAKAAAGEPVASTRIGNLTVVAPKRVRLGKVKRLVVGVASDQAGQLTLSLVRGKKVHAKVSVAVAPGSKKHSLKLSKRLKAGGYSLTIAFKPAGASWTATGKAKIALLKARR